MSELKRASEGERLWNFHIDSGSGSGSVYGSGFNSGAYRPALALSWCSQS